MKTVKELSGFIVKVIAIFLCINLVVVLVYGGSILYGNYRDKYFTRYTNDIEYVAENYPDHLIDSLAGDYAFDTIVVTTDQKSDFIPDNIKKIEFREIGDLYITVYFKDNFMSFNPKWLFPETMEINDIQVKYINSYSQTFMHYSTTAVFNYNSRQYSIMVTGDKSENINTITEIIKAMV